MITYNQRVTCCFHSFLNTQCCKVSTRYECGALLPTILFRTSPTQLLYRIAQVCHECGEEKKTPLGNSDIKLQSSGKHGGRWGGGGGISSHWILMSCQLYRVTSGQSNRHKHIHISKLFSCINLFSSQSTKPVAMQM